MTPTDPDPATMTFDEALAELQRTVAALEAGGQPLEASIALYERGVALHERCAGLLADAELRVKRLVQRAGGAIEALEIKPPTEDSPAAADAGGHAAAADQDAQAPGGEGAPAPGARG